MDAQRAARIVRGEVGGSRWVLASRPPSAPLRPFVLRLAGYEEVASGPGRMRQFPETHVVVIVEFGPPLCVTLGSAPHDAVHSPGGFVAGLGASHAITEHAGVQRGVQIDLTPTGARRLFGLPLCEISDRIVPLVDLLPTCARHLAERLAGTADWDARLDLVEALFAERILSARLDTACVDWALARVHDAGGAVDVGTLARELGYSHKHVIALFRDQVGIGPKLLARLVRFHRVMRLVRAGGPVRGAELALACGYYDQAHLARDVKQFTGLPLNAARAELSSLADLLG